MNKENRTELLSKISPSNKGNLNYDPTFRITSI